ncbi:MAG: NUDIX domain-containing protein [Thermoplasmatota archaeon]
MTKNTHGYVAPALAVDAVLLKGDEVLLIRRANEPHRDAWALPGGFVEVGETVEAACLRELAEETHMLGRIVALLGVWSDPKRDPRGHTVTVTFACAVRGFVPLAPAGGSDRVGAGPSRQVASRGDESPKRGPNVGEAEVRIRAGSDAADARWFPLAALPEPLAFDHGDMIRVARAWLAKEGSRAKLADEDCD